MKALAIIFWIFAFVIFYTYVGYGMLAYLLVALKERFGKKSFHPTGEYKPDVTLLIAAYNEEDIIEEKMENCRSLIYPAGKLHITWVTDGSTDGTVSKLSAYGDVTIIHDPRRGGKTAALNHAMEHITTPIVVLTDANTYLNPECIELIVREFEDPRTGCVSGEKRVRSTDSDNAAGTEGFYWKYESFLKDLDSRLYSTQGAAGELFAIRRELWKPMGTDTLLDDFICSMEIAASGYKIAYCKDAYALESPSLDIREESKRKRRIAAGGLQSVWRLRRLMNPLRYGMLSFQFVSHRVLRWCVTPSLLFLELPLNIALLWSGKPLLYGILLACQLAFYALALYGMAADRKGRRTRIAKVAYYFLFMNVNTFRGMAYLASHRGNGAWEKAKRS